MKKTSLQNVGMEVFESFGWLAVGVESSKASESPDREYISVRRVADCTRLVKHSTDHLLREVAIGELSWHDQFHSSLQNANVGVPAQVTGNNILNTETVSVQWINERTWMCERE